MAVNSMTSLKESATEWAPSDTRAEDWPAKPTANLATATARFTASARRTVVRLSSRGIDPVSVSGLVSGGIIPIYPKGGYGARVPRYRGRLHDVGGCPGSIIPPRQYRPAPPMPALPAGPVPLLGYLAPGLPSRGRAARGVTGHLPRYGAVNGWACLVHPGQGAGQLHAAGRDQEDGDDLRREPGAGADRLAEYAHPVGGTGQRVPKSERRLGRDQRPGLKTVLEQEQCPHPGQRGAVQLPGRQERHNAPGQGRHRALHKCRGQPVTDTRRQA